MADKIGSGGKIISLEADPSNVMVAQAQMSLNRCGDRCEILHRAGSDESGTLHMEATAGNNTFTAGKVERATLKVEAVRGDDLAEASGPFDLLKVDVEGFEKQVLMGCQDILSRRPRLALELHLALMGEFGATVGDIFDLIDVGRYEGQMMIPARATEMMPFDPRNLPDASVVNLFLRPKGE
jgi:FkbM family methyltransferase